MLKTHLYQTTANKVRNEDVLTTVTKIASIP